ncbi:unnamed protein product [marine sediment metagenome]|uniref:HNH nuclease domain-containing protein n=1 Tax=marine sediment metagenome TaxID=412755 RepID=X0SJ56_9ZZZZ
MPTGVYPRTEYHKELIKKAIKLRHTNGERFGFQKGHPYGNRFKKGYSKPKGAYAFPKGKNHWNWQNKNCYSKEYRQFKHLERRKAGELTIQIIQQVYEDNIKRYGTLTCYLCLNSIKFGKDNLEHKIPLSRGGTNARDNLDIACKKCNSSKCSKTVEEYKLIKEAK